jgi:hypothetical protein
MRAMLTFRIPPEEGNAGLEDGRFTPTLHSIMEDLQPEAAYFGPVEGARGGYLVVNVEDAPEFCAYAEPLFLGLGASVQIAPVFIPEEVPRVVEIMESARRKYSLDGSLSAERRSHPG